MSKHWNALEEKRWQERAVRWRAMASEELLSLKLLDGPIYIDIAPRWFVEEFFPL